MASSRPAEQSATRAAYRPDGAAPLLARPAQTWAERKIAPVRWPADRRTGIASARCCHPAPPVPVSRRSTNGRCAMEFGIALPTAADAWKVVKRAEELGFTHA
jgi:hypothetical protein